MRSRSLVSLGNGAALAGCGIDHFSGFHWKRTTTILTRSAGSKVFLTLPGKDNDLCGTDMSAGTGVGAAAATDGVKNDQDGETKDQSPRKSQGPIAGDGNSMMRSARRRELEHQSRINSAELLQNPKKQQAKSPEQDLANLRLEREATVAQARQGAQRKLYETSTVVGSTAGKEIESLEAKSDRAYPGRPGVRDWFSPQHVDTSSSLLFSSSGKRRDVSQTAGATSAQGDGEAAEDCAKASGSDSTRKEAEAEADDWSDRRRLVEKWDEYDEVWISMRKEAKAAAEKEPLLVSFIYSTILNQNTLEAAVAFHLANKLAGPNMLSTQVQALVRECFAEVGHEFRRQLRRDIIAVRERDPACESYHDCLLYFKGFQALQTHRVAHWLYHTGRHALAFYLQSQVNQEFQIDIHPGASFGEGVFIDHGTGIVVGETAVVGDDVSMLHRVTLGGSGVKNKQRHPKIGNGVLIGAGACLLGNITVGKGTQIGAGSLVVDDLPERCVAVGVPAKVLGQGRKRKPALAMGQDFFKEVWKGLDI